MSKYTSEVRFICESVTGLTQSTTQPNVNSVITNAIPKIFDFEFPLFDPTYKNVLCTKILKHYYTREIGLETYGLWKLKLDTKLNEIMPYYNQLYLSAKKEFDPFNDVSLNRTHNTTGSGNNKTTSNGSSSGTNSQTAEHKDNITNGITNNNTEALTANITQSTGSGHSDTPQGELENVKALKYLTTYDNDESTATNNSTKTNTGNTSNHTESDNTDSSSVTNSNSTSSEIDGNFSTTESYIESLTGKQSSESYSARLIEWRKTFINIDMQVIDELSELFMNIY